MTKRIKPKLIKNSKAGTIHIEQPRYPGATLCAWYIGDKESKAKKPTCKKCIQCWKAYKRNLAKKARVDVWDQM